MNLTYISKLMDFSKYFIIYPFHIDRPINGDNLIQRIREDSKDIEIQIINLMRITGKKHIYFAILNALHAFRNGMNISRNPAVEILLYASGQNQISEAIKIVGVDQHTRNIAIVAIGEERSIRIFSDKLPSLIGITSDDNLLENWGNEKIESLVSAFKISKNELKAMGDVKAPSKVTIEKLIIERMAFLSTTI